MNAIMVIHPYQHEGVWVFDDPNVGLVQEPFVSGADVILDHITADVPNARSGVTVLFSASPFPGYQFEFARKREEYGGHWYFSPTHQLEGWLCPALFRYFEEAPERLYVQVKAKE